MAAAAAEATIMATGSWRNHFEIMCMYIPSGYLTIIHNNYQWLGLFLAFPNQKNSPIDS